MTVTEFKLAFPAFETKQRDVIQRHLTAAEKHLDAARWEDSYDEGIGNYAAHTMVVEDVDKATGMTLAMDATSFQTTAGAMSRLAAGVERSLDQPLMRTHYGRRYLALARLAGMGAVAF